MSSVFERVKRFLPRTGPLASGLGRRIILCIVVVGLSAPPLLLSAPPVGVVEGQPAPRTFRATRQIQFEDAEATAKLRESAADSVLPVLRFDRDAALQARTRARQFYIDVEALAKAEAPDDGMVADLALTHGVPETTVRLAATMDAASRREADRATEDIVGTVMTARISESEVADARLRVHDSAALLEAPPDVRELVAQVGSSALRPSVVEDEAATEAAREDAASDVSPVTVVKVAGENIVMRGEIVTARHLEILAGLGILKAGSDVNAMVSLLGLLALLVVATGIYLYRYERRIYDRMRLLVVMASLFVGMLGSTRLVLWFFPEASPYVMPAPLAAMLGTLLISPSAGVLLALTTTAGAALLGVATGLDAVAVFVSSLVGIVALSSLTQRRYLVYAGAVIVSVTAVSAAIATLASSASVDVVTAAAGYGAVGGLTAVVLAYGLLPFFESVFGVTTDVRLLELSSPSAPLLRELMATAPGTYSHSVLAGSLAETAADAIGANPLLARVGAYYHDVGKMSRPVFFAENLAGGENPHDEKTPWLSASIITAHVRDGIEIAQRHKLPREVVDIIRQHHGDSLVTYFYSKAAGTGENVYESDFRYSGERPRCPEAALVMLADSVEAAMRTIRGPSLPEVEKAVREVVREKVDDGQLDECDLTLADIETVVHVYAKMLVSIYHPRVKYPQCPVRRPQDASQRYEPSRS